MKYTCFSFLTLALSLSLDTPNHLSLFKNAVLCFCSPIFPFHITTYINSQAVQWKSPKAVTFSICSLKLDLSEPSIYLFAQDLNKLLDWVSLKLIVERTLGLGFAWAKCQATLKQTLCLSITRTVCRAHIEQSLRLHLLNSEIRKPAPHPIVCSGHCPSRKLSFKLKDWKISPSSWW